MKLNLLFYFFLFLLSLTACEEQIPEDDSADISGVGHCSADVIIDHMIEMLTPDDYDEGKANIKYEISSFKEFLDTLNRMQGYSRNVSDRLSDLTKRINSRMSEVMMEVNLSPDCMKSLARIGSGVRNGELWALKFLDAQAKPSNGMLELSGIPIGNYDECLSIESPDETDQPKIRGQYCGASLSPLLVLSPQPKPQDYPAWVFEGMKKRNSGRKIIEQLFTNMIKTSDARTHEDWLTFVAFMDSNVYTTKVMNGLCIPTTCNVNEVSEVLNHMMYPITHMPVKLDDDCDYEGKPVEINKFHIISLAGVATMLTIFLISSIIDFTDEDSAIRTAIKGSVLEFIISCFSVKRNAQVIFSVAQDGKFRSLDGLRAILTFYVVVLHTYEFGLIFLYNKNHYHSGSYKMTQDYRNMILPNILLMDTFFIISAFLLGNTMLSRMEMSRGRFNWINYILFRYFRLLPIILTGLAATFIFELIGDGPVWNFILQYFSKPCYDKWHRPLLMYNNHEYYVKENSTILSSIQCMTITWYSSCDFQLYALAPLSWFALYKLGPKKGLMWNILILAISVSVPVFNRVVLGLPHVYEISSERNFQTLMIGWEWHYWAPISYIQTYIIGILVAYAVRYYPKSYLGGRKGESLIWMTTITSTVTLLYWQRNFMAPGYPFDKFNGNEMPVYLVVHKLMYLQAFAWLIYACETGRGGWLYKALSWKVFKFFDNVTVEIYILHVFAFVYRIGVRRDQITYTEYYIWTSATFDYVATYMISVCVALTVTRPFFNLTQALLHKGRSNQSNNKAVSNGTAKEGLGIDNPVFVGLEDSDIKKMNVIQISNEKNI